MEPCNKKSFQVRHSSIMSLTHFLLESIITRFFFWWQEDSASWNLSTKFITDCHALQHLFKRGSKKKPRREWDYFKFHKKRYFFSLLKNLSAIWGNPTLHPSLTLPKKTSLSSSAWPRR